VFRQRNSTRPTPFRLSVKTIFPFGVSNKTLEAGWVVVVVSKWAKHQEPSTETGELSGSADHSKFTTSSNVYMGVSKNRDTPKWMVKIMENPIKIDDLGVALFLETSTSTFQLSTKPIGRFLNPWGGINGGESSHIPSHAPLALRGRCHLVPWP